MRTPVADGQAPPPAVGRPSIGWILDAGASLPGAPAAGHRRNDPTSCQKGAGSSMKG